MGQREAERKRENGRVRREGGVRGTEGEEGETVAKPGSRNLGVGGRLTAFRMLTASLLSQTG